LFATNAILFADEDLAARLTASSGGTDKGARRVFALPALHWESYAVGHHHVIARVQRTRSDDSGQQVRHVPVRDRACQLATVATQAFLRISVDNHVLLE
jgi:hypothetical protein